MHRTQRLVGVLRVLLAPAFAALVLAQVVVLPATARLPTEQPPEPASLTWPLLTVAVLVLVCVQVVIACTWRLLTSALLRQATTLRTDMEAVS